MNRLIRTAADNLVGDRSTSHACATSTKSGLPGGCGIPSTCAAVMYSPESQKPVLGASVSAYSTNTARDARAAAPYAGRRPASASSPAIASRAHSRGTLTARSARAVAQKRGLPPSPLSARQSWNVRAIAAPYSARKLLG